MRKIIFILICFTSAKMFCIAQVEKPRLSFGGSVAQGNILSNSGDLSNSEIDRVKNLSAAIHWHHTDQETFNKYACFPKQTVSFSYYNFDNALLGNGVVLAYTLAPHFLITKHASLFPSISVGGAVLSNPYSTTQNPGNKLYSLPISAYLALGGGFYFQFSSHWGFNTSVEFSHISNGGWKDPNNGLNWPQLNIGVEYSPKESSLKKLKREINKGEPFKTLRGDITVFGLIRSGLLQNSEINKPTLGIDLLLSKQIARIHAWTVGVELYQDQLVQKLLAANNISSNGIRSGALVGHEFLLNRFIFSQQLGVYLAGRYGAELLYHRWGLQYSLTTRFRVGVNLRAYKSVAEFTDLRLSYSFLEKK